MNEKLVNKIIDVYYPISKEIKKKRIKFEELFEDFIRIDKIKAEIRKNKENYKIEDFVEMGKKTFMYLIPTMNKISNYINKNEIEKVYLVGRDAFCFYPTSSMNKKSITVEMIGVSSITYFPNFHSFGEVSKFIFYGEYNNSFYKYIFKESINKDKEWKNVKDKILNDIDENRKILFFDSGFTGKQPYFFKKLVEFYDSDKKENAHMALIYSDLKIEGLEYDIYDSLCCCLVEDSPKPIEKFEKLNFIKKKDFQFNLEKTIPFYIGFNSAYIAGIKGTEKGNKYEKKAIEKLNKLLED